MTVPIAAFVLGVVAILLIILAYNCMARKKKSDEPYAYRPLSDMVADEEEEELERDQEEGMGGREDTRKPGDMGREELEDMEKGEDN